MCQNTIVIRKIYIKEIPCTPTNVDAYPFISVAACHEGPLEAIVNDVPQLLSSQSKYVHR